MNCLRIKMNAVIVFAKYPHPGKVKTRLGRTLSPEFAAEFYKLVAEHTFDVCLSLPVNEYDLHLFYTGSSDEGLLRSWVTGRFHFRLQAGEDLGEKMKDAFRALFNNSYKKVIIIGTDCPEIDADLVVKSFEKLAQNNIVVGPSPDGGYYLLGMDKFYPFLFDEIQWSSGQVFSETIVKARRENLSWSVLPELIDIDTKEDLSKWLKVSGRNSKMIELIDHFGIRKTLKIRG